MTTSELLHVSELRGLYCQLETTALVVPSYRFLLNGTDDTDALGYVLATAGHPARSLSNLNSQRVSSFHLSHFAFHLEPFSIFLP